MKDIKNILIVGGGSSGWMTAAALMKNFPEKNITLIESSDIPTIGVGESTLGSINTFLNDLGLKDEDWMEYCNATYKTSIDFTNFDGKNTRTHYPFGVSAWKGKYKIHDWFVKQALIGADKTEYAKFALGTIPMIDANKLTKNEEERIQGFNFAQDTAYHFDAGLFGDYLKREYCIPRGINHKIATVNEVTHNNAGVTGVIDTDGIKYLADLYIDCTGFKSMLLTETLKEPFVSFSDVLINDKAVTIRMPYQDKELEMEHSTNATALSSGWVWNIPLWNRIGTGYVYSSKFQTEAEAYSEFKEFLINDRDVPHSREEIETIKPLFVDINPGIHERAWVKNVVAIGLSNGFIEPLESTGLMLTHNTIFALVEALQTRQNKKIGGFDKQVFNKKVRDTMELFSGFIATHFAYAERDDSAYWKYVTEEIQYLDRNEYDFKIIDTFIESTALRNDFSIFNNIDGSPFIMAAMGYNPITRMQIEHFYQTKEAIENEVKASKELLEDINKYNDRQEVYVKTLPSHYEFLKEFIYKEK